MPLPQTPPCPRGAQCPALHDQGTRSETIAPEPVQRCMSWSLSCGRCAKINDMQTWHSLPTIFQIMAQSMRHRTKGELIPRNLLLCKKSHRAALRGGAVGVIEHATAEHEVHLVDAGNTDDGNQGTY